MTLPPSLLTAATAVLGAASLIPTPDPTLPPGEFGSGSSLVWSWMLGVGFVLGGIALIWAGIAFFQARSSGSRFHEQFSTLGGWVFGVILIGSVSSIIGAFL